ncbi:MAG: hypothetical protein D6762_04805 [Candidatus Neomarinimicrobiota bacterium]|nr:MAG: hypothetical protein D6762_04805 [Candidatus Neomarinimicrobiota bacterium]
MKNHNKITAIFSIVFMISVNLVPVLAVQSRTRSRCDLNRVCCCDHMAPESCPMEMSTCKDVPLIPLLTAPVHTVSVHQELDQISLPVHSDLGMETTEYALITEDHFSPDPPPAFPLPLLI